MNFQALKILINFKMDIYPQQRKSKKDKRRKRGCRVYKKGGHERNESPNEGKII